MAKKTQPTIEIRKLNLDVVLCEESEESIAKFHEESRYILGKVYSPNEVDSQGDFAAPEDIELAAWQFMINGGEINLMHKERAVKSYVVENYIQRQTITMQNRNGENTTIKKGTWMLGILLDEDEDEVWSAIKSGAYKGFSMEGMAEAVRV